MKKYSKITSNFKIVYYALMCVFINFFLKRRWVCVDTDGNPKGRLRVKKIPAQTVSGFLRC